MGKIHFHQEQQKNITKKILNKMSKQTAVKWLQVEIDNKDMGEIPMWIYQFIEQAKEMEKDQIMNSWVKGVISDGNKTAEQYYNETFKNK